MFNSIRSKTTLILLLFSCLPLLISGTIIYPKVWRALQEATIRDLEGVGYKQANLIRAWMKERKYDAKAFANEFLVSSFTEFSPGDEQFARLVSHLSLLRDTYEYKEISIIDNSGVIRVSTREDLIGTTIENFDYSQKARIPGKTFVSDVMPSAYPIPNEYEEMELGVPTLFVSSPVRDKTDQITGVICLRVDVMALSREMRRVRLGETGETYLVDKNGFMISESRFLQSIKDMGLVKKRTALELKLIDPGTGQLTKGVQACLKGESGYDAVGYSDYRGSRVLGFWHWLSEYQWAVMSEIDVDEAYGAIRELKKNFFYMIVALFAVLALAVLYVGRKIAVPIIDVNEATKRVASGDYTHRLDVASDDELGELASSFNSMAKALEEKECINNFNRIIASSLLTEVFDAASKELKKLIDFDRFSITSFREEKDDFFLTFVLSKDNVSGELTQGTRSKKEGSLFEKVLSTSKPVVVDDTEKGLFWSDKTLFKEGIRSRMAYPLTYRGEVIGAMNFGSKKPGNYSEENFNLLSRIAPQMVVVLENARLIEKEKQRPEGGG